MRFTEVTPALKSEYELFLVEHHGPFLQSWDWGEFQEGQGEKVRRFVVYSNVAGIKEEKITMVVQVYERTLQDKKYFFAPYGPVFAPEFAADYEKILAFFCKEIGKQNRGTIFVRVEPYIYQRGESLAERSKKIMVKTVDQNPHQTLLLDLIQPMEKIQDGLHPKTRYNIKLAEKKGVTIKVLDAVGENKTDISNAIGLFMLTSARAGIRAFPTNYYLRMFERFCLGHVPLSAPQQTHTIRARLYTAWHENDLLGANMVLYYHDFAFYLFGGSSNVKRNFMAPSLLHFHTITDAKIQGMTKYDFWGVELDPKHPWHGFSRFKLGFGGEVLKFAGTWDYVLQPTWYNAYKILRLMNRGVGQVTRMAGAFNPMRPIRYAASRLKPKKK